MGLFLVFGFWYIGVCSYGFWRFSLSLGGVYIRFFLIIIISEFFLLSPYILGSNAFFGLVYILVCLCLCWCFCESGFSASEQGFHYYNFLLTAIIIIISFREDKIYCITSNTGLRSGNRNRLITARSESCRDALFLSSDASEHV
jgi:hypothetical protein